MKIFALGIGHVGYLKKFQFYADCKSVNVPKWQNAPKIVKIKNWFWKQKLCYRKSKFFVLFSFNFFGCNWSLRYKFTFLQQYKVLDFFVPNMTYL
jgi:hypothetical protein